MYNGKMPLNYMNGEEIRRGDRILLHGEPGEIELVADPSIPDPATDWYVQEYGRGVMVLEPRISGRAFLPRPEEDEDLKFVARGD